ncbi:MAG: hypothetical protein RBQ97_02575 [Acholeplasma sp.]|nr:hypothetical protein [Acholeplasma sp.]
MKINDVLKLNDEVESLNIIQTFLSQPISQNDYETAIILYLKIAFRNNLNELVISEGLKYLDKVVNIEPSKRVESIYKYLIDSSIQLEKFDDAKIYIEKRKSLLPIINQYLSLVDEWELSKARGKDCFEILKRLSVEVLPSELRVTILEELLKIHLNKNELNAALAVLNDLKEQTIDNKYDDFLVQINYKKKNYDDVVALSTSILNGNKENPLVACYYIAALIKQGKFLKASTMEAEYELIIDEFANDDLKEFIYEELISLYGIMNNNLSKIIYEKKLRKLKRKKPLEKEEKVITKEKIEVKEVTTTKVVSNAKYLEHFEWIRDWLITSHQLDLKTAFREYLRSLFIEINNKVAFKEIILYVNGVFESNFFNYKLERLYDKKIIKQYLDETIIGEVLEKKQAIFGDTKSLISKKDVLTQKPFSDDVKYIYAFYLDRDVAMAFYLDQEIADPSIYYELLSGISVIILSRLIDEKMNKVLKSEAKNLDGIVENPIMPMRILTEFRSDYNEKAIELFRVDKHQHFELFLREIPIHEADIYETKVNRLLNYPNESYVINYNYQNLSILEYMFAIKNDGKVQIISFFVDQTNVANKQEELNITATIDNETELKNKYSLVLDLEQYLESKNTFVLIELNQDLRSVYGNERLNKFFIEFGKATKKHFMKYGVYRYDFNQLMVVLDFNDIRSVNKELIEYFQVIYHLKSKILNYESFNIKAGVLRYPVVTVEKNSDKIFRYLDVALDRARHSKEQDFVHFVFSDYEKEIFEQEVIDYLNTAIETKQLGIQFKQIIDLDNNVVWNYESEIYLPTVNIDNKYLFMIAKKRKKIISLEQFHIELICSFLSKLEKETGHLIKLTIPISKETFTNNEFQSFLVTTLKKYQIPAEFIRILCDLDFKDQSSALKVQEIVKMGISVDTNNIEMALSYDFNAVHLKFNGNYPKWKNYYKGINTILNNMGIAFVVKDVNSKENRDIVKSLGISYLEGEVYQTVSPSELVEKIKVKVYE